MGGGDHDKVVIIGARSRLCGVVHVARPPEFPRTVSSLSRGPSWPCCAQKQSFYHPKERSFRLYICMYARTTFIVVSLMCAPDSDISIHLLRDPSLALVDAPDKDKLNQHSQSTCKIHTCYTGRVLFICIFRMFLILQLMFNRLF